MTLTQERLKELLEYNESTGIFTWKVSRGAANAGSVAGAKNPKGYLRIKIDGKDYLAHRLAWFWTHGEWPADQIDHINHDRADNRITNLRGASRLENSRNKSKHLNNSSGFTGVHWNRRDKKWVAQIKANGKSIHIGHFTSKPDAIAARKEAEKEFGFHSNHGQDLTAA